jgi:CO/xanthine dehydrogenase FAD-binding subunit
VTDYIAPTDLAEATRLLGRPGAAALAGGQSLLAAIANGRATPSLFVDLARIDGLDRIEIDADRVRLGATATLARLLASPAIEALPALGAALEVIGNPVIRHRSTVGGNLAWADPLGELSLLTLGLGGTIRTTRRSIAAADFVRGAHRTALEPDELIAAIELPRHPAGFAEIGLRPSGGRAIAAALVVHGPSGIRVALSGIADRPVAGEGPSFAAALTAARAQAGTPPDRLFPAAYRLAMADVAARRAETACTTSS